MQRALEINRKELAAIQLPELNQEFYIKEMEKYAAQFQTALQQFDESLYGLISNLTMIMRFDDDNNWSDLIWTHNHLCNLLTNTDQLNPFLAKLTRFVNYYLDQDDE